MTAYLSWMMGSVIWVFGFLYVNENNIDSYSSNLSRATCLLAFNLPMVIKNGFKISPVSFKYINIRHILLTIYGIIFAECFFYLPISVVHTIYSGGPVFVIMIDYFIHSIKITTRQSVGVIIAIIGVILTVNGPLIYYLIDS